MSLTTKKIENQRPREKTYLAIDGNGLYLAVYIGNASKCLFVLFDLLYREGLRKIHPVCGMKVDEVGTIHKSIFRGESYVFCSKHCQEAF